MTLAKQLNLNELTLYDPLRLTQAMCLTERKNIGMIIIISAGNDTSKKKKKSLHINHNGKP